MAGGETRRAKNAQKYRNYDENYRGIWKRGISRKIGESAFVQQTLPTMRLSWSPIKICPFLLLLGGLFIGMGIGIKEFAKSIHEIKIPYTNCSSIERPATTCYKILENATNQFSKRVGYDGELAIFNTDANDIENCTCAVPFELKDPFEGTVYMYYSLSNFHQNYRKYYQSRDEDQLKGKLFKKNGQPRDPSSTCNPLSKDNISRIIYPCGLMANSMFTDVIELSYHPDLSTLLGDTISPNRGNLPKENMLLYKMNLSVPLNKTGIAWDSDRMDKYHYPPEFYNARNPIWSKFVKPYGWKRSLWQLDPNDINNNGVLNEDFIVWMRAAAFPWFKKLYRIVDRRREPFQDGLPAGNYTLNIQYNYDVSAFNGEKEIIFTTSKMVAGRNIFLSVVYIATGSVCICLSIILFIIYKCFGVKNSKLTMDDIKKD